jgi:predicted glycosyltransferase
MKRLMFYCQHILGIGHLVRSMEIVRGLMSEFQVCFINGGEVVQDFPIPAAVEIVNLPAIKTDTEFRELQVLDDSNSVESVMECRRDRLLEIYQTFQPDVLMIELFPFGRRRFSPELTPLLDSAKAGGTKVVCSLRDIVVTKQDRNRHEAKICKLINQYFDLLLIHGDPEFIPLETSFSRVADLTCEVHYTGYVVQQKGSGVRSQESGESISQGIQNDFQPTLREAATTSTSFILHPSSFLLSLSASPLILVSVGGGRFGHELLDGMAQASALLEGKIPHQILMFTGPFAPDAVLERLQAIAHHQANLTVERYTPDLLHYMKHADLSISMAGYNTTMNVLTTGVRSLLLPFTGNDDQEQTLRSQRLEELGVVTVIHPTDLHPERFAERIITCLQQQPSHISFDLQGVEKTAHWVQSMLIKSAIAA